MDGERLPGFDPANGGDGSAGYKSLRTLPARPGYPQWTSDHRVTMGVGTVFLEALLTGVITPAELHWLTAHQADFTRVEEATALRLGRLLDDGAIQLGCRIRT